MEETPVFRANKRRKFMRQRDDAPHLVLEANNEPLDREDTNNTETNEVNVSDILKLRKQSRARRKGVQFSQQKRLEEDQDEVPDSLALTKINPDQERLKDISNRFTGSTGQIVDVDKHMMAYIDSEMAKRQSVAVQDGSKQSVNANIHKHQAASSSHQNKNSSEYPPQAQLSEIDLGPDAYERNLARTEAAVARAHFGLPPPEDEPKPRQPRKPRLGRDGKPLRPRPRKRRNSEDVARDALVEQMLREHKMDVYEGNGGGESGKDEEDEDADERLAEQFKQDFMDAMAERQQKNQTKAATAAKAKGMGPDQSGPKLGGSRSARAKMAMQQQQQSQQQKGPPGQK